MIEAYLENRDTPTFLSLNAVYPSDLLNPNLLPEDRSPAMLRKAVAIDLLYREAFSILSEQSMEQGTAVDATSRDIVLPGIATLHNVGFIKNVRADFADILTEDGQGFIRKLEVQYVQILEPFEPEEEPPKDVVEVEIPEGEKPVLYHDIVGGH